MVTNMYLGRRVSPRSGCCVAWIDRDAHFAIGFVTVMRRMKQMQASTSTGGLVSANFESWHGFCQFHLRPIAATQEISFFVWINQPMKIRQEQPKAYEGCEIAVSVMSLETSFPKSYHRH